VRVLGAAICALVLAVTAAAADGARDRDRARLVVVTNTPLTLQGYGFVARERVRITVTSAQPRAMKRARAGVRGRFRVMFESIAFDRCGGGLEATAVGDQGTRAVLKRPPQPLCPPRL
jgi:hypothetical protein